MVLFTLLYIIAAVIPIIYWYFTRNFNYWSKRGIKGPTPVIGVGNLCEAIFKPMPENEVDNFQKYGKIYGKYSGNKPYLVVGEPELIKIIMVKDFHIFTDRGRRATQNPITDSNLLQLSGDDWKRVRSIVSPSFTSGKLKKMYPIVRECLNDFIEYLEIYANEGKYLNVKDAFGNYTMDVIASCAFATKANTHKDPNNPFIFHAKTTFNFTITRLLREALFPKVLLKLVQKYNTNKSRDFFIHLTQHLLKERKSNPNKKFNDFLQILVEAERDSDGIRDQNDVYEAHHVNEGEDELSAQKKAFDIHIKEKHLNENEILAQALTFLLAGYETTATTLSFCAYELAINESSQEKLHKEIVSALDSNGDISYETLYKLPFLDAVISETLRLHSPALKTDRMCSVDNYKLGNTGITLSKGQNVQIPIYAIQHSEEFYPNANQFIPERFLPENKDNILPYTYLPFGGGPRNCIGMRFALMEAKLGLAHIIKKFRFVKCPETDVPIVLKPVTFITTAKRNIVGIEKR